MVAGATSTYLQEPEPVQKVIFSFYNRKLYKIVATYDNDATAGLTAADMIDVISASYGPATKSVGRDQFPGRPRLCAENEADRAMGRRSILRHPFTRVFFERLSARHVHKAVKRSSGGIGY